MLSMQGMHSGAPPHCNFQSVSHQKLGQPLRVPHQLLSYSTGLLLAGMQSSCMQGALFPRNASVQVPDVDLPLSYYLGALGMPGMTAYVGLKRIAEVGSLS